MHKLLSKTISTVLVSAITATLTLSMVGCSKSQETMTKSGKVEITFWEDDDPGKAGPVWKEIKDTFEKDNPDIKVNMTHYQIESLRTNYQNAVAGGEGPSLASGPDDILGVFGTAGTAMQLDNFLSKEFIGTIDENAIKGAKIDGKLYGVPYRRGNCLALLYNKKLVNKAPETINELIEIAKNLTKGTEQYGLVFNMDEPFFYIPFLGGYGGSVFNDKGDITLNTDAMRKTAQLVYDFKFKYKITSQEANYDVSSNLFKEGKAAFIINGPWSFDEYKNAGIELGIARLPKTEDGLYPSPYLGAKVLVVNPNLDESQKEAVKKFLEFVNNKENQIKLAKATNDFPTNKEALADQYIENDINLKALADQMKVGTPMPIIPEMRAVWDGIRPVFKEIMAGRIEPKDAPAKMQSKALERVKSMMGK